MGEAPLFDKTIGRASTSSPPAPPRCRCSWSTPPMHPSRRPPPPHRSRSRSHPRLTADSARPPPRPPPPTPRALLPPVGVTRQPPTPAHTLPPALNPPFLVWSHDSGYMFLLSFISCVCGDYTEHVHCFLAMLPLLLEEMIQWLGTNSIDSKFMEFQNISYSFRLDSCFVLDSAYFDVILAKESSFM